MSGLRQEGGGNGAVHPAAEGQEDLSVPDLLPEAADGGVFVVLHGPVALRAADLIEEVPEHGRAVLRVIDLRVELDAVEVPGLVGDGGAGAGGAVGREGKALRNLLHIVAVAHPGGAFGGEVLEELTAGVEKRLGFAVFPGGIALGRDDAAPQVVGQELTAVADAQDGHAQAEELRVRVGGGGVIDAVGPAGEDDADGRQGFQVLDGGRIGLHFAVNALLPDPAGDELVVLASEIQDDDGLVGHKDTPFE